MDFIDFWLIWGTHLEGFLGTFGQNKHNFVISIFRLLFLMIFGSESGCLELENPASDKEGLAKIIFYRNWISHDSRTNFHDVCCPGDWLDI